MPLSNVLVVVVDGLRASALGAYGNTTYSTSTLDQFAAESLLLDECYAPAADLAMIYRALWQSRHPARPDRGNTERNTALGNGISLPHIFAQLGFDTTLVTDAAELAEFPCAADFHQVRVQIDPAEEAAGAERVDDIVETKFAQLLAAVHGDITQRSNEFQQFAGTNTERPRLIWVHSQGMHGPWDAPLDLQRELFDEEDAPPLETTIPPNIWIVPDADPDIAYRHSIAYAAQVVVLDTCWQKLMDSLIASNSPHPWLVILVGARGFPLGEHRKIGGVDSRLPAEQLHVPCLIRFPDTRGQFARNGALISHLDILPTLLDCANATESSLHPDGSSLLPLAASAPSAWRESLISTYGSGMYAIRTKSWCLRTSATDTDDMSAGEYPASASDATSQQFELFVRPDDRWEANDVSKLCPDVVEELQAAASEFLKRIEAGDTFATSQ